MLKRYNLVYLVDNDSVLMLKKAEGTPFAGKIIGFGGSKEKKETSEVGAIREFFEESGLLAGSIYLKGLFFYISNQGLTLIDIYSIYTYKGKIITNGIEGDVGWYTILPLLKDDLLAQHQLLFLENMLLKNLSFFIGGIYIGDRFISIKKFTRNNSFFNKLQEFL